MNELWVSTSGGRFRVVNADGQNEDTVEPLPPWDLGGYESERMADLRRQASKGVLAPWARDIAWLLDIVEALGITEATDDALSGEGVTLIAPLVTPVIPVTTVGLADPKDRRLVESWFHWKFRLWRTK
jgi:hypothetical protein